jgi:hypothetical protein
LAGAEDVFKDDRILSVDLKNATYSISFDVVEENERFLDRVMAKFPPWKTFHKLFKIKPRNVDLSQLITEGYLAPDSPESLITKSGVFMGDTLAFVHLTLTMLTLVEETVSEEMGIPSHKDIFSQIHHKRPIGQSVGDDMIVFGVTERFCDLFKEKAEDKGLVVTKIHSKSKDSGTFCENYVVRFPEGTDLSKVPKESKFGDLVFLDALKGSVFSGKSKVKQEGSHPFLGHAKLLFKQINYLPDYLVFREGIAKTLLWSRHFREAAGLSRALPSLPPSLGGANIAIGRKLSLQDESLVRSYLPYYYGMLKEENQEIFLFAQELLLGIFRTSSKGFEWDPLDVDIMTICQKLKLIGWHEIEPNLPAYASRWTMGAKIELSSRLLGFEPLFGLGNELMRRQNFLDWWNGMIPPKRKSMLLLRGKEFKRRHEDHWKMIREIITPSHGQPWDVVDLSTLSEKIFGRTRGLYFHKDDPAIKEAFLGMPSLFINY